MFVRLMSNMKDLRFCYFEFGCFVVDIVCGFVMMFNVGIFFVFYDGWVLFYDVFLIVDGFVLGECYSYIVI